MIYADMGLIRAILISDPFQSVCWPCVFWNWERGRLKGGTGLKVGVGFTLLPLLDFNIEYRSITNKELDISNGPATLNLDYNAVIVGFSLPFTLKFKYYPLIVLSVRFCVLIFFPKRVLVFLPWIHHRDCPNYLVQ